MTSSIFFFHFLSFLFLFLFLFLSFSHPVSCQIQFSPLPTPFPPFSFPPTPSVTFNTNFSLYSFRSFSVIDSGLVVSASLFLSNGTFIVPSNVTLLKALLMGGGAAGTDVGGGSGYLYLQFIPVQPGDVFFVKVGRGGLRDGNFYTRGEDSRLGNLISPGGMSGGAGFTGGENGGSGGGAGCDNGKRGGNGGSGGDNGGLCADDDTVPIGLGQGQYLYKLMPNLFVVNSFSAGAGGKGGNSSSLSVVGGGGGGGIRLNNLSPTAAMSTSSFGGSSGEGFGAGGGGGGLFSGTPGNNGLVYLEYQANVNRDLVDYSVGVSCFAEGQKGGCSLSDSCLSSTTYLPYKGLYKYQLCVSGVCCLNPSDDDCSSSMMMMIMNSTGNSTGNGDFTTTPNPSVFPSSSPTRTPYPPYPPAHINFTSFPAPPSPSLSPSFNNNNGTTSTNFIQLYGVAGWFGNGTGEDANQLRYCGVHGQYSSCPLYTDLVQDQFRWGTGYLNTSIDSGLGISEATGQLDVAIGQEFPIASFFHFNQPILAGSAAQSVILYVTLRVGNFSQQQYTEGFMSKINDLVFAYSININETVNNGSNCPLDIVPCSDYLLFSSYSVISNAFFTLPFRPSTELYTLELLGLRSNACNSSSSVLQWRTTEKVFNEAVLIARIIIPGSPPSQSKPLSWTTYWTPRTRAFEPFPTLLPSFSPTRPISFPTRFPTPRPVVPPTFFPTTRPTFQPVFPTSFPSPLPTSPPNPCQIHSCSSLGDFVTLSDRLCYCCYFGCLRSIVIVANSSVSMSNSSIVSLSSPCFDYPVYTNSSRKRQSGSSANSSFYDNPYPAVCRNFTQTTTRTTTTTTTTRTTSSASSSSSTSTSTSTSRPPFNPCREFQCFVTTNLSIFTDSHNCICCYYQCWNYTEASRSICSRYSNHTWKRTEKQEGGGNELLHCFSPPNTTTTNTTMTSVDSTKTTSERTPNRTTTTTTTTSSSSSSSDLTLSTSDYRMFCLSTQCAQYPYPEVQTPLRVCVCCHPWCWPFAHSAWESVCVSHNSSRKREIGESEEVNQSSREGSVSESVEMMSPLSCLTIVSRSTTPSSQTVTTKKSTNSSSESSSSSSLSVVTSTGPTTFSSKMNGMNGVAGFVESGNSNSNGDFSSTIGGIVVIVFAILLCCCSMVLLAYLVWRRNQKKMAKTQTLNDPYAARNAGPKGRIGNAVGGGSGGNVGNGVGGGFVEMSCRNAEGSFVRERDRERDNAAGQRRQKGSQSSTSTGRHRLRVIANPNPSRPSAFGPSPSSIHSSPNVRVVGGSDEGASTLGAGSVYGTESIMAVSGRRSPPSGTSISATGRSHRASSPMGSPRSHPRSPQSLSPYPSLSSSHGSSSSRSGFGGGGRHGKFVARVSHASHRTNEFDSSAFDSWRERELD